MSRLIRGKKIFYLFIVLMITMAPGILLAAEEAHEAHGIDWLKDVAFPWINFSILFFLLIFLLRRPLKDFLLARSISLAQSIEAQAHEKQDAEAKALNYERRLKNIEKEVQDLTAALKKEGELARVRIVEDAKESSERIREMTERIGRQEVRKAKERLKEEAVELAAEFAEKRVRESLKPQDKERLTEDAFQKLEQLT